MNHRPVAIALILCELIIVDEKTRNVTPVNCFTSRKVQSFPCSPDFHVLAWLTDGFVDMPIELMVRRLDSLDEVYRIEENLRFDDRMKDMRFTARIRNCVFPVAGYYEVLLSADGELIANRKILIQA